MDERLAALVAAGREAVVNAAKWSGAPTISLFGEVEEERVSVYVRDRGAGFDPDAVAPDRRGIAESIKGRMARHGGTAVVRTMLGQGTEVELGMARVSAGA
jgi:signal transduction histidine kinase